MAKPNRSPLWKWILFFILGFICFVVLYSIIQGVVFSLSGEPWHVAAVYVLSSIGIVCLYYLYVQYVERRHVLDLPMLKLLPDLGLGLLTGFLFFCAVTAVMALTGSYRIEGLHNFDGSIGLSLALFLAIAVCEEIVFRGIIFRMIDRRWNTIAALIVSALLFGFSHLTNPGATVWSSVAIAIEAGLLLGAAYKYSGNLWLPIGIHWAWNFSQSVIFGFPVSGNPIDSSLISAVVSGPKILTGGEFGAEASIISVVLGLGLSIWYMSRFSRELK